MNGMVLVTLLCCRLLRYVLTMVVFMCFMFVLICESSMVLVFVSMSVVLYVVCFLRLGVVCCDVV